MHYLGTRYIEKILEEGPLSTKISPPPTSDNSQKRSDYLLLIQARLYGWPGCVAVYGNTATYLYSFLIIAEDTDS